ncbi:MAG: 50S ribosomal protein L7/L12 [Candidatus Eisenbacteria sp.]|nr:50S ribosomal protein L7/L12 [Candidatus Eisenbacteria bacterium]
MAEITKDNVIEWLETATMLDVKALVDGIEEKFGVTAAAPMMAVAGAAPGAAVEEEQTEFDVVLTGAGSQKIQVIKVVRQITSLGLKEAKELVDSAPKAVKEAISREEADDLKTRLTDVGASVEIK